MIAKARICITNEAAAVKADVKNAQWEIEGLWVFENWSCYSIISPGVHMKGSEV